MGSTADTVTVAGKNDNNHQSCSSEKLGSGAKVIHKWVPWTKAGYTPPPAIQDETSNTKSLKRSLTRAKSLRKSDRSDGQSLVNVIIFEDLIECNGLEKGVQTRQKHMRTKRDRLVIPDGGYSPLSPSSK